MLANRVLRAASSCSGIGPGGCITTYASRSTGVLASCGCPEGSARSIPSVRRGGLPRRGPSAGVHTTLEGVISVRRVRRRRRHRRGTPVPGHLLPSTRTTLVGAVVPGRTPRRHGRREAARDASSLSARRRDASSQGAVAVGYTSTTSSPPPGWDPEGHPRSGPQSDERNEEVKADPDRLWRSDLPAARRPRSPLKPSVGRSDRLMRLEALTTSTASVRPVGDIFGRERAA